MVLRRPPSQPGRGNHRAARAKEVVDIAFANITDHGPQLLRYMAKAAPGYIGIAAHHRRAQELPELEHRYCSYLGYKSYWTPAEDTGRGGTQGGTAFFARKHLASTSLIDASEGAHFLGWQQPRGWTAATIRLEGISVVIICLYLKDGIKCTGVNQKTLIDLGSWISTLSVGWAIFADWNMSPGELAASGWVHRVRGTIEAPAGVTHTCSTGGGSLIDFVVFAEFLRPFFVGVEADLTTPWSPHCTIVGRIRRRPRTVLVRTLQVPRAFDLPAISRKDSRSSNAGDAELNWHKALECAAAQLGGGERLRGEYASSPVAAAGGPVGMALSALVVVWASAAEAFLATSLPGAVHPGVDQRLYKGRCTRHKLSIVPACSTVPASLGAHASFKQYPRLAWWGTVKGRLREYRACLIKIGKGISGAAAHAQRVREVLQHLGTHIPPGLALANDDPQDALQLDDQWRDNLADIGDARGGELDALVQEADRAPRC